MLDHLGERQQSERIRAALDRVLAEGRVRTRDLGGTASTTEFTEAICSELDARGGGKPANRRTNE